MTFIWPPEEEDEEEKKPPPPPPVPAHIDAATREKWAYLMEVMGDYETFLGNIGSLGYSAPQLLYYRDEVQEFLEEFAGRTDINVVGAWQKINQLDIILRAKAQILVDEIGHKNFVQYQIQNDPPRTHWWWWINRITAPPTAPPKFWEFWKHQAQQTVQAQQGPPPPIEPPRDQKIADLYKRGPGPGQS